MPSLLRPAAFVLALLALVPAAGCTDEEAGGSAVGAVGEPTPDLRVPGAGDMPIPPMTPPPGGTDPASFQQRVFYELWVRSYQDSDGDGIGDIPGLIERLDELADLGVGGIWLMPTFPSPLADSGYDVAGYREVHPDYGSLADMDRLIEAAHERGILVYLDMVFNHTSDQHPWFQSALTGPASPHFDHYVWADEPLTQCTDVPAGPFGSTRWTRVDELDKWYFHGFYPRQPDLNFENPVVRAELLDVLRFWLDRGVDGFRFDVPDRFYEHGQRCTFAPETIDFHGELRRVISGTGKLKRGFVGEIWAPLEELQRFFGPDGNPMAFNFELMFGLYTGVAVGASPRPVATQVDAMLRDLPAGTRWGLITGNHDTPRFYDVAGGDPTRVGLAAAIQLTLPGVPFVWMGEELGLPAGPQINVDWRDGTRTPQPWTAAAPGYGFTTSDDPHLAFPPAAGSRSWTAQRQDPASLLNHYRRLIAVRNASPALRNGSYREVHRDGDLWAYERTGGGETALVVHNFSRIETRSFRAGDGPATDRLSDRTFPSGVLPLAPGQSRVVVR